MKYLVITSFYILSSFILEDKGSNLIYYKVLSTGDTINRMTPDSLKEGKWFEEYYLGASYYYEVGNYIGNLRFGEWRVYNSADEMIEKAEYFRGAKNGYNILYQRGVPYAQGEQVGMFYTNDKDTIPVTDPIDLSVYAVEVENNSYSLRNGTWYFRDPFSMDTTQKIVYYFGHIKEDIDYRAKPDPIRDSIIESKMPHNDQNYKPIKKKPRRHYFPD